ncbi:unnamed protein product [Leuciscus chuanchicus]
MNFSVSPATWLEGANIHLVCVATWIIAAVWSSFPLFGWGEYVPEPYGISCTVAWRRYHTSMTDAVFVICSFACFVLVPVLLIVVSQCKILLKIYRFPRTLSTKGLHINLRRAEKHLSVLYTLVNVYNHKEDRHMLYRLRDYLRAINTKGVLVVGGDFNTVLDPTIDRISSADQTYHSSLRSILEDFTDSLSLKDIFALRHPTEEGFTRSQNQSQAKCPQKIRMSFLMRSLSSLTSLKHITPIPPKDFSILENLLPKTVSAHFYRQSDN